MSRLRTTLVLLGFTFFTIVLGEASDKRTTEEKTLDEVRAGSNGIWVGQPKVYDDSVLQQMLSAAEARLASLQIIDQVGIASKLGSITGATQTINSFGLSLQGPPIPQVVTTANGPTNSAATGTQNSVTQGTGASGPTSSTTASTSTQNTANAAVTNVATTSPQLNPPTVTAPTPSTSLPSSFSVSASDILNEQMQLTYEIANLRLLLEGSLNDRIVLDKRDTNNVKNLVKPRVTLGFPITLRPDKRHKNAIAVVEVELEKVACAKGQQLCETSLNDDPPAIVALLPRDKTYNVASITDSSVSIGAGVVTQVFGISGSFLHARKTYYLVQDQDTVALTFEPSDKQRAGFLWEFRPVLGGSLLREGLKQTFVQIALPSVWSADPFGTVHVRTYWRDYDSGKNLVKAIRGKSLTSVKDYPIPNLPIDQRPKVFSSEKLEDQGNGQMLVDLEGRFLGGTAVRVGSNLLRDGNPNFSFDYQRIRFVAPIADLATKGAHVVARDGTETPLLLFKNEVKDHRLTIKKVRVETVDDTNSRLSVEMNEILDIHKTLPLILMIGGKVFGYSDAPLTLDQKVLTTVVPNSLLAGNPWVSVRALFTDDRYWSAPQPIVDVVGGGVGPKLALLETDPVSARFLLSGAQVDANTKVLSPRNATLQPFGNNTRLYTITLDKVQVKSQKQIVVQRGDGFIFQLAVPSVDLPDATKKPTITPVRPLTVGTDEAAFKGEGFNALQKVVFNDIVLKLRKQADGKVIWLRGLKAAGVTADAKKQSLDFYFSTGKQAIAVDVVAP